MRTTNRDPISGNDVAASLVAPFVIEGKGRGALKIYFESEQNKNEYLQIVARLVMRPGKKRRRRRM